MENSLVEILNNIPNVTVLQNEPLKEHTTFKIGGPAAMFARVGTRAALADILAVIRENNIPFYIIGNGSNLLVSDSGYDGIIIKLEGEFDNIIVEGENVYASAGALLSRIGAICLNESLTGFEFASGIPGSLGGGMIMNAGAYGGELKDITEYVTVMDYEGNITVLSNEQMQFEYRSSFVKKKPYIVLAADFKLKKGDKIAIKEKMQELAAKRMEKQPLEYPSAGSTFKRPEGYFAGKLIEDAGLSGYTIGGASVSTKHKGFVINAGDATAEDVTVLIRDVQRIVKEKFGVTLETEVIFLGD